MVDKESPDSLIVNLFNILSLNRKFLLLGAFDAVVASEVLEHVDDVPTFIASCSHLIKKGSPMFFTTINRTIWSQLFAITLAEVYT